MATITKAVVQSVTDSRVTILPALSCLAFLWGCGGGSPPPTETAATTSSTAPAATASANPASASAAGQTTAPSRSSNSESRQQLVHVDADGRKWIGEIPYDVWFDDPLAVASNTTSTGATMAATTEVPPGTPTGGAAPMSEPMPKAGPTADWATLLPARVLSDEVADLRNALTGSLQSVGQYNTRFQEVQLNGAILAAMAAVAGRHPGDIRWKENAPYLRDLGVAISDGATERGRKAFEAAQVPFEQALVVLNGSVPAGLEKPVPQVDFGETVSKADLMRRIEIGFKWLRTNTGTEEALKGQADKARHEALILSGLGMIITDPSYGSTDEKTYQELAKVMIDGAVGMNAAIDEGNFSKYSDSLNAVQQSCDKCHAEYRFSE